MMHPDYAPQWQQTGDDGVATFDNVAKTEGVSFNVTDLRGELHDRHIGDDKGEDNYGYEAAPVALSDRSRMHGDLLTGRRGSGSGKPAAWKALSTQGEVLRPAFVCVNTSMA